MTDHFDLANATTRALKLCRLADEYQQAADEAHGTPEMAATAHADAAKHLRRAVKQLTALMDAHAFLARRMDQEHQREQRTGTEYRLHRVGPRDAA